MSDTGSGLLEFLPALGQREAIAFGDGVTLPVRLRFDMLPPTALPRSSTARFSEKWQSSLGDEDFLDRLVERWRTSGGGPTGDAVDQTGMLADAMGIPQSAEVEPQLAPAAQTTHQNAAANAPSAGQRRPANGQAAQQGETPASLQRRAAALRREQTADGNGQTPPRPSIRATQTEAPASEPPGNSSDALKSIRERLLQRKR